MVLRLLLLYAVVEFAVVIALASTIGWGWTLLALVGTFLLGWGVVAPMAGSHLIRQIGRLRSGLSDKRSAVRDGTMYTLATILVLVPGLATSVAGLLLLVPPIRSAAAPALAAVAVRGLQRRVTLVGYPAAAFRSHSRGAGRDYIDGEVIDVHDVEPPALPHPPTTGAR
jgi:UPF0716 protein FxsA